MGSEQSCSGLTSHRIYKNTFALWWKGFLKPLAYTLLEADSFEFEMLGCNQSRSEHSFYLGNVSRYWRVRGKKRRLKGTLDLGCRGMRHGGPQVWKDRLLSTTGRGKKRIKWKAKWLQHPLHKHHHIKNPWYSPNASAQSSYLPNTIQYNTSPRGEKALDSQSPGAHGNRIWPTLLKCPLCPSVSFMTKIQKRDDCKT